MSKFCTECGKKLIKRVSHSAYSAETGRPTFYTEWLCPESDTALGFWGAALKSIRHPIRSLFALHTGDYGGYC